MKIPTQLPNRFAPDDELLVKLVGAGVVGDSLDLDAAAFIARVEAADGQPLEPGVRLAYSDFVARCKSRPSGILGRSNWQSMQTGFFALHCGQRTLAGALVPLIGPTPTNNNFVAEDYSRTQGIKGDGVGKDLSYNVLGTDLPVSDRSLGIYITEHPTRTEIRCMMGNGPVNNSDSILTNPTTRFWRLTGSASAIDSFTDVGYFGASKLTNLTFVRRYRGVEANPTIPEEVALARPMRVFSRLNSTLTSGEFFSNGRIIMSHFCLGLDMAALEADVLQLSAEVNTAIIAAGIVSRVEAADGQHLREGVAAAIGKFVKTVYDAGAWDETGQFTMGIGARTLAGNLVPWIGSALTNSNFTEGDSDSVHGILGNSSTKGLVGVPENTYPQDDFLAFCYITSPATPGEVTKSYFGGGAASGNLNLQRSASGDAVIYRPKSATNYTVGSGAPGATLVGFVGCGRNNAAASRSYARGSETPFENSSTGNSINLIRWFGLSSNPTGTGTDARMFAFGYMRFRNANVWRGALEEFYQSIQMIYADI